MNIFLAQKCSFENVQFFSNAIKIANKNPNKIKYLILIFFLQYFNYFGEVMFSPLIYFNMKYFSESKIIKTKNPRFIIW